MNSSTFSWEKQHTPQADQENDNKEPVDLPNTGREDDSNVESIRQGHIGDGVRRMLLISTVLAALVLFLMFFFSQ